MSQQAAPAISDSCHLVNLPYELRLEVYHYVLESRGEFLIKDKRDEPRPCWYFNPAVDRSKGLLHSCRQIREEFRLYIFSHSVFHLTNAADSVIMFLRDTPDWLLASIRCVNYQQSSSHPLAEHAALREVKSIMPECEREDLQKSVRNFKTIFRLIADKLKGLFLSSPSSNKSAYTCRT